MKLLSPPATPQALPADQGVPRTASSTCRLVLPLSVAIQLILGLLLGHAYDMRVFMAAGYQVASGHNPYAPSDLSIVFQNPAFQATMTVGYPPPWPIVLGQIYRVVYSTIPAFLAYNLAIKIPIILANIGLAVLVVACLRQLGADEALTRRAWAFMLLNPFLLYASAGWGQIDSIVALFSLASLMLLASRRRDLSAIALAIAVSVKPTAIPLMIVPYLWLRRCGLSAVLRYYAILALVGVCLTVAPFFLLGWDPGIILQHWNVHFVVGGGLSPLAVLELIQNSYELQGSWRLLGMAWVPALLIGSLAVRFEAADLADLLKKSAGLVLIFFLTRAWLSEPNIILLVPLIVVLTAMGQTDRLSLHALWVLPILFGIVNTSAAQLLFPSMPRVMEAALNQMEQFRTARLIAKVILVIPWQIIGWRLVQQCLRPPAQSRAPVLA